MDLAQHQSQRQQARILPGQIQLLNLFHLNGLELNQRIATELSENFLLEECKSENENDEENAPEETVRDFEDWDEHGYDDIPNYKEEYANFLNQNDAPNLPLPDEVTFRESLKQQISLLPLHEEEKVCAAYIIDSLNQCGLLERSMDDLADSYSFYSGKLTEAAEMENCLLIVQSLEPVGVGARSARELLLLQLKKGAPGSPCANLEINLLENYFEDLLHRRFEKIQHEMGIDRIKLREILTRIGRLKFNPADSDANSDVQNRIVPDYIVASNHNGISVQLYNKRAETVTVNSALYEAMFAAAHKDTPRAGSFIAEKWDNANWFVSSLKKREETMLKVFRCMVTLQKDYFNEGDMMLLKPMVLKNVSELTGLDMATISRVTAGKYAETHFGMVCLKNLFSEGIDCQNESVSNKVIRKMIGEAIDQEDKCAPLTDSQLAGLLEHEGYFVARRTVAKYREQLSLPASQARSVWKS